MEKQPHDELCDFITNKDKSKKLILLPRGSFKSSIATIGYPMWSLVNDPNIRILISSETYNQSKQFLKGIKNHIEQNDTFRMLYGELKPASDSVWRQDEITIVGRKVSAGKEPSVCVSGVGMTKVGMHYDKIILDDVVSDKNINTPEQIQKIIDHYRLLLSILDPGGELIIIGTRYSYADLYGHLLSEAAGDFSVLKRGAYDDKGKLYFPTRLTMEFLEAQRKAQGSYHFSTQYLNEPVDEDSAMFKTSWLKYYKEPPKALRHFICLDPAGGMTNDADYTALVVAGIDFDNNIYVIEAIQTHDTIADITNLLFRKVQEYDVHEQGCVGLETNAMQHTLKYIFTEEMNKRNFYFPIKELKGNSSKTKPKRIKGLQPYFENGKIYVKKDQYALIDQITRYPRTKHDDLIDAFAYVLEIMCPADVEDVDRWAGSTLSRNEKNVWQELEKITTRKVIRKHRI